MSELSQVTRRSLFFAVALSTIVRVSPAQQRDPRALATQPAAPATRAPAAVPPAKQPAAPFRLTAMQQHVLHQVLVNYEKKTGAIKTFSTELSRLEFDGVFGPSDPNKPKTTGQGTLMYTKPDKARYEIGNVRVYDGGTKKYKGDEQAAEFVVVNGQEVIAKNFRKKQVHVTELPKELQGKGIFYGPLPFVFGAKAADLERRYFMRLTTPEAAAKKGQIWLEAWPRYQADAANYKRVDLIIRASDMLPLAIQVHSPNGKNRTVYTFANQRIDPFKWNPFADEYKVRTPFGWKRFVEKPPTDAPRRAANPAGSPRR